MHIIQCVRVPDSMSHGFKHAEPLGAEGGKSQSLQHTSDMLQPNDTSVQICGGILQCAGNMRGVLPEHGPENHPGRDVWKLCHQSKDHGNRLAGELAIVFRLEALSM